MLEEVAMKCTYCKTGLSDNVFPGGNLNEEQWEVRKAGDYYCPNPYCPGIKAVKEKRGPGIIGFDPQKQERVFFTK